MAVGEPREVVGAGLQVKAVDLRAQRLTAAGVKREVTFQLTIAILIRVDGRGVGGLHAPAIYQHC